MTYKTDRDLFIGIVDGFRDHIRCHDKISYEDIENFVDEWMDQHHVCRVFGIDAEVYKQKPDQTLYNPEDELLRWVNGEEPNV